MEPPDATTLVGLVERFSPTGQEGEAVAWLVKRMQALGYARAFADEAGNAVGVLGEGPRQIVLLGHIDTAPGCVPVRREGDFLYGRGAVDAKGPLAAFTDAVARFGPRPGWQLVVIGAVDEEGDSKGARHAAGQYHPDFAIIGEPSRWDRITLGYKGSAVAEVAVHRQAAHPASGVQSACEAACEIWENVRAWCAAYNRGRERAFEQILPALRGFSSGGDGLVEWARLRLGVRLPPGFSPEDWLGRLGEIAAGAEVRLAAFPIPAYQGEKNTPLVRAFLAGIRAAGGSPGFVLKTGTADLNLVAPVWGCPAAAYGPGDSALDHAPDERLSLEEYARAVRVLQAVLAQLCA